MILQVIVSSLAEIQNNFMSTIRDVEASWSDTWTEINRVAATTTQQIFDGLTAWYQLIQGTTVQALAALGGAFGLGLNSIYGMFSGTFSNMVATAQSSMASIVSTVSSALAQVLAMAAQMSAAMVGHSIWPSMLEEMQAQAQSALGNIVGDFQGAFGDVVLSVPVMPSQAGPSRRSESSAPLISLPSQNITVPVQVQIDGATVARTVTTRLVRDISARRMMR